MNTFELLILVIAYTVIVVTIFLEVVCYKRNIETPQTIAFTVSLLLLIVALTISSFFPHTDELVSSTTDLFTLLAMILVGLTTPLNILEERQHRLPSTWSKSLVGLALILFVATLGAYFMHELDYLQYVVAFFLGTTVLLSMLLLIRTKPKHRIAHREHIERIFSIAFLVLVPFSLAANYVFENIWDKSLQFGFAIPTTFILLAGSKLWDDLQRLSLLNPQITPKDAQFKHFALTEREKEMALLLVQGKSYRQISEELYISLPTVKTHASNIYRKCGVNSRHELTAMAIN